MTHTSVSQTLRQAIRDFPLTQSELARRSGVDQGIISRFANEQRTVTTRSLDPLCSALGLELRPVLPARARRKAKKKG